MYKPNNGPLLNDQNVGRKIKDREIMYRMVISQLIYDGHDQVAILLASIVQPVPECPPSSRLLNVVQLGLQTEQESKEGTDQTMSISTHGVIYPGSGIDLEFDSDIAYQSPLASTYEMSFVNSHKAPIRAAAFSKDGAMAATGSEDQSIKLLDVERMSLRQGGQDDHPVIKSIYDHSDEITCLDFHPFAQILASGSRDFTVKMFDYGRASARKSFRTIHEAERVSCLAFHPSGDYLLVGCEHPIIRLYDSVTLQCFVCSNPKEQHKSAINAVTWSPNANLYASCSKDGSIKIWDGLSSRCVSTWESAHGGEEVCSVQFSRNSKYVLSSGKDSLVKLWELSTSRSLISYTGAGSSKQQRQSRAVFNHTEDFIFFPDESTGTLCSWDARNTRRCSLLGLGHTSYVTCIVHSLMNAAMLTCSDDHKLRYWVSRRSPEE